jgi:hypothetical protein
LAAALAEAFHILDRTQNPTRDVVVLTDGQRFAWRPGEPRRWELLRELRTRMPIPPRIWAVAFADGVASDAPNGSVGPLAVSRALVTPGLPVEVTSTLSNAGPGPLTRTVELLVDGLPAPGAAQVIGPVPEGGKTPLSFRTVLQTPGAHLVTVRLLGDDDAIPSDDEAATPVEVTSAVPVLLVDGEPGLEPLSGEADFLRAALAPTGDDTPQVRTSVVTIDKFQPQALKDQRVLVLANVDRLGAEQTAAVGRFLDAGGGLLIAPGDRSVAEFSDAQGWSPARLGRWKGDPGSRTALAHPAPGSFSGPLMTQFAQGDAPALAEADFFSYHVLEPAPGASVLARLDTSEPWIVERTHGKARVHMLATAIDAEAGTLPVNPDFVPLVHEWILSLAGTAETHSGRPGEPLVFDLNPPPPADLKDLALETPGGTTQRVAITRAAGAASARVDDTSEAGIYRLSLPEPPGGFAYALIPGDGREADLTPLARAEADRLAKGWPLVFERSAAHLSTDLFAAENGGRNEVWRGLILAALAGLCVEVYLTRQLIRSQGLAG